MKIYSEITEFIDEQTEALSQSVQALNQFLKDDLVLIIEAMHDTNEIHHFYLVSKKMDEQNLDINFDYYFQFGVDQAASHLKQHLFDIYSKLHGEQPLLSKNDDKSLNETISFLIDADNKIGLANFNPEIAQFEITSNGFSKVLVNEIAKKPKAP